MTSRVKSLALPRAAAICSHRARYAGRVTSFSVEHVFPKVAPVDLLRAFTHREHLAAQDRAGDIERREIVERIDDDTRYHCESWVYPRRKLPALVRPLVRGGLEVHEKVTWTKTTDTLEIEMHPAILGGRCHIRTQCRIVADPEGARRLYRGEVTVDVSLIGGRIEKMVAAEISAAMGVAHATTLRWFAERAA